MDNMLTKDAKVILCLLYKDYLAKRDSGLSKSKANRWGTSHVIHEKLIPKWSFEDVDDTCRELSRAGAIICDWADNIAFHISISDSGIIYMENHYKKLFLEVVDLIGKFVSFIP